MLACPSLHTFLNSSSASWYMRPEANPQSVRANTALGFITVCQLPCFHSNCRRAYKTHKTLQVHVGYLDTAWDTYSWLHSNGQLPLSVRAQKSWIAWVSVCSQTLLPSLQLPHQSLGSYQRTCLSSTDFRYGLSFIFISVLFPSPSTLCPHPHNFFWLCCAENIPARLTPPMSDRGSNKLSQAHKSNFLMANAAISVKAKDWNLDVKTKKNHQHALQFISYFFLSVFFSPLFLPLFIHPLFCKYVLDVGLKKPTQFLWAATVWLSPFPTSVCVDTRRADRHWRAWCFSALEVCT